MSLLYSLDVFALLAQRIKAKIKLNSPVSPSSPLLLLSIFKIIIHYVLFQSFFKLVEGGIQLYAFSKNYKCYYMIFIYIIQFYFAFYCIVLAKAINKLILLLFED